MGSISFYIMTLSIFIQAYRLTRNLTLPIASWFCIQCLARFFQGLSISLLELNTFGHAICTLFIYALWWHKPLDITEPERVNYRPNAADGRHTAQHLAAMCTKSKLGHRYAEVDFLDPENNTFEFRVQFGRWKPPHISGHIPYMVNLDRP